MAKEENKKVEGGRPEGQRGQKSSRSSPPRKVKHDAAVEEAASLAATAPPRLKVLFDEQIRPLVAEKFGLSNPMAQPRLDKIVLNVNMGRHIEGAKIPPQVKGAVLETLVKVTGQRPVVLKAKKSVSNFKVREGLETAAMVTIRRERMWNFLDRLINLATPRIKDFRGVGAKNFDNQGNYAMGLTEQGVFPEINMADAQFTHGMNINFVFRNSSPELSRFVLEQMGMPFVKPDQK